MALIQAKSKWISAVSLSVLCAVTIGGCSKKDKDDTSVQTDTELQTTTETPAVEALIPCDDTNAVNSLSRSIKDLVAEQTRVNMSEYAAKIGADVNNAAVNGMINNIIIDVGTPKKLNTTNNNGMQTCQASLSMTLPSEHIYLANEVYSSVDGQNMQQKLAAANIRLNNNLLVDDAFTYVVGMQGGQVQAKVVGRPAMVRAVADIMAKSQLKEMISKTNRQPARPLAPPTPRPVPTIRTPAEPRIRDETVTPKRVPTPRPVRPDNTPPVTSDNTRAAEPEQQPTRNAIPNEVKEDAIARTLDENRNAVKPLEKPKPKTTQSSNQALNVPTDESMDMVIIEEDATY